MSSASPSSASSRISRAAKRTKSDPNSPPAFVPSTSVFSFSRVLSDAGILLMGCSFVGRPIGKLSRQRFAIRRWCTPPRLSSNFRTSPSVMHIDVGHTIETDQGEFIYMRYEGVVSCTNEKIDRMSTGTVLWTDDCYFVIAPTFETVSEKYRCLDELQAIGKAV